MNMIISRIPDDATRERYIQRVIDIYAERDMTLTIEQASKEAERLYHLEHDDWLGAWKEWEEQRMCREQDEIDRQIANGVQSL